MKKIADLRNAAGGMLRGQSARSLVFVARTFCPKLRASERSPASDFIVFVEKQNRGEVAILNRIRAAERSRLLFGLELAARLSPPSLQRPNWIDFLLIEHICADPKEALQDPYFSDHIQEKARAGDYDFFQRLGIELQKRKRRKSPLRVNNLVARWWTNPHWPLWMMTDQDAVRVIDHLFKIRVSVPTYSKVVERHCLVRFGPPAPIVRVNFHKLRTADQFEYRQDIFSDQDRLNVEKLRKSLAG